MKHNKYLILLLSAFIIFSSCKKQLDIQPTDTFSDENSFRTMADIQQGAYAAYSRYGAYANNMYVSALLSDEARLGAQNAGQGALTYRFQYFSDNTSGGDVVGALGGYYRVIDQVNRVLPKISTVIGTTGDEPRRNEIRGQLLALRAGAYFELLQFYSDVYDPNDPLGVPVVLESNPLGFPSRNSMGEVMAQVDADFAEAKTLLPAVTPATFSDTVMNRVNVAAYQARVALYKRDYDAAVTFATEVISSDVKPLVSGSEFAGIWTDTNPAEVLFRVRYETSTAIGSMFTTTSGAIYVAPSDKLVASYDNDDIRLTSYIGTTPGGDNYVNKFYESPRGGRAVDLKVIRIAEMYLIRAEANARKSSPDLAAAAADLNLLRTFRIDSYVDQTFPNATALIDAIMEERFKELAFEGHRFFDLKRTNMAVERWASDANAEWQTLPAGNFRFVLPIANDERLANPNFAQNPGY